MEIISARAESSILRARASRSGSPIRPGSSPKWKRPELYLSSASLKSSTSLAYTAISPFRSPFSWPNRSIPRSSQIRRKTIRSMVFWTEEFSSLMVRSGLFLWTFLARISRQESIYRRKASSTAIVPLAFFFDSMYLSRDPPRTASWEKRVAISSQRSTYLS